MTEVSHRTFGLLIAYLLPGFTTLWGASYFSPTLRHWLLGGPADAPTLGGFLYVTVASVAAGLTVSTVRWMLIDTLHHWTGVPRSHWDFAAFREHFQAYDVLTENHYRYHQFYANMLVALVFVYLARRMASGFWSLPLGWADVLFLVISVVFLAGSRDTFQKYHARLDQILTVGKRRKQDRRERR